MPSNKIVYKWYMFMNEHESLCGVQGWSRALLFMEFSNVFLHPEIDVKGMNIADIFMVTNMKFNSIKLN